MLKCRQDVHDKYCDFSEITPLKPMEMEYEQSDDDSSDTDEEIKSSIMRQLWVSPSNQHIFE